MIGKTSSFLFLIFFLLFLNGCAQDMNRIRIYYQKAATDKAVCQYLIINLSDGETTNVELAYLGALETIWAKYINNPFSKLSTFNEGKEKIETAIKKDSNNVEIRYLRLTVQKNAPTILGYNDAIKTDELFLENNLHKVSSKDLRKMIKNLLIG